MLRICAIAPASKRGYTKNSRPGASYDFAPLVGHAHFCLITSTEPPTIRFWDPYVDISISRTDAAVLLKTGHTDTKNAEKDQRQYAVRVRKMNKITIHTVRHWQSLRE